MDATELADLISEELRAVARPERAAQEKRYLKSDLEFFGASVWEIRRVVRAVRQGRRATHPRPTHHPGRGPLG